MKKNAFTLIELLAVIVILAIIALIATPIILGIINDTKEQSKEISAENYLDAVEQAIVRRNLKEKFKPTICTVISEGLSCEGYDESLKVEVDGKTPTKGIISFSNGSVSAGTNLSFEDYTKKINNLAKKNVKAVTETTKTTGIVPVVENGDIKLGSEFKIKVNDTSDYLTFFVLSNEGDYVNLIAEQNIAPDGIFTSERQDGDEWYKLLADNRYGPQTAYTYLSIATSKWTNIPIIEDFTYEEGGYKIDSNRGYQSIITKLNEDTAEYTTTITPYSSSYGNSVIYKNMRTRLPKYGEVTQNTICKTNHSDGDDGSCPLWMVNYLYSSNYYTSNKKVNSNDMNLGYWLLSSYWGSSRNVDVVCNNGYIHFDFDSTNLYYGIRPVITVLKSDLLRVMQ